MNKSSLKNTVLVTGASRGIGLSIAKLFAQSGYIVYANYRGKKAELDELCAKAGGASIIPVRADVCDAAEIEAMLKKTGGVDILVNNAGSSKARQFIDIDEADWEDMLRSNLTSAFLCTKAAIGPMLRQKWGRIINISSVWGVTGGSCEVHYSAAKAGLIGFTKALAKEMGPSGILVNCIAPGAIDTRMNDELTKEDRLWVQEHTPLGTFGLPGDVAGAALFLARSSFITGEVLNVNGGFHI
ncbi:MAG: 3-oxoacyl-ACP reductase family protein [Bacillota bacterium]